MPTELASPTVTPFLALLADVVHGDFGPLELSLVRQRLALVPRGETGVAEAGQFFSALATVQKRTLTQLYVWAGTRLVAPVLKERPMLIRDHTSVRTILLQLSRVGPSVVEALVGEGSCPDFWEDYVDGETIQIGYDGQEEVAWLLEGAITALGAMFGERVELSRGVPPAGLLERRLLNVRVVGERRTPQRQSRTNSGLSSAGHRGYV